MKKHRVLEAIRRNIPKKKVFLYQKDFKNGTYRIVEPGIYVLRENILFAPNPDNEFQPKPHQRKKGKIYSSRAYSLGFFAAITIETSGVEIDLNGFSIDQSHEMAYMQRFYAAIETASTPFIPKQGPGNFGSSIVSPNFIYIHGGTLGRSSHHSIHGNGNRYVYVKNVRMVDYEFVAAALNGSHYVVFDQCHLDHSFQDLKVLAAWSTALFARQFLRECKQYVLNRRLDLLNTTTFKRFVQSLDNLDRSIQRTKNELMENKRVSDPLFRNDSLIGDGNMYGLLSHSVGFAIHDFNNENTENNKLSKHWWVEDCLIENIRGNVDEVLTLKNAAGKDQVGPAGDVLKLRACMSDKGKYVPNVVSEAIFALADLKAKMSPKDPLPTGTLHIDNAVREWKRGKLSLIDLQKQGFQFATSKDSMAHTNKGVLGIRIDGTRYVTLKNVEVRNIENIGREGSEVSSSRYKGCLSSGIHLAYVSDVTIENTKVHHIVSENGVASGVQVIHHSEGVRIFDSIIHDVRAGRKCSGTWKTTSHDGKKRTFSPTNVNPSCSASGILWEENCDVHIENTKIYDIEGPQRFRKSIVKEM